MSLISVVNDKSIKKRKKKKEKCPTNIQDTGDKSHEEKANNDSRHSLLLFLICIRFRMVETIIKKLKGCGFESFSVVEIPFIDFFVCWLKCSLIFL